MDRLIVFGTGAALSVVSEIFWRQESRWTVAIWGGTGMLLMRRIVLRFPFVSRALLCLAGALPMLALRLLIFISVSIWSPHGRKETNLLRMEFPSFSYALYRFLLLAPAYTIIEYLEAFFGM